MKRWERLAVIVSIAVVAAAGVPLVSGAAVRKVHRTHFNLFINTHQANVASFLPCLAQGHKTPKVRATVTRGRLNDTLSLSLQHFKKGLSFDLFTVQNSNQDATGGANPLFNGFGLSWYQSDIHIGRNGTGHVTIKTILLDQIFGFVQANPVNTLSPTNTFHLGFWFDNVAAAQPCATAPLTPTPFNGDHTAGPLAFITRPNATTGLGPLCTDPTSGPVFSCNP